MKNKYSSNLFEENFDNDISRENVIKLILQNLIDRYSLKNIINDIISITKQNEKQLKLKDKIPLNPEDIISILYKNVGSIKLYQCLLDISEKPPQINRISKKKTLKKENFINYSNIKSPFSTVEEEKYLNNNTKNNKFSNIVIEIEENTEEPLFNHHHNDKILSLSENGTTVYEIKDGGKSELKKNRNGIVRKRKREEPPTSIHNNGIYSESKLVDVPKKLGKVYENKLGYHYVLERGNIYKYKAKDVDNDKEIAKFICDDPKCNGYAEYSIKNKTFKLLEEHNIPSDEHLYNKNMVFQDMNILNYMMEHNIEDLQLTRV